ncbi:hypothetical protein Q1695_009258 [Nippostrongylus brasiliensis]|nr:hypothetical protein Q1695_009258 [Nippostrongylus brasiliensis]
MSTPTIGPGTSSPGNGYAKYRIRSTGIPRVLATETEVFTLDDHEDEQRSHEDSHPPEETEKSRLFDCPLDSDEEKEEAHDDVLNNIRQHNIGSVKEKSRLTDSFDMDDSLSDDLDLLPPIPGAPSTNHSWMSKFHALNCCNPRIPSKCTIM